MDDDTMQLIHCFWAVGMSVSQEQSWNIFVNRVEVSLCEVSNNLHVHIAVILLEGLRTEMLKNDSCMHMKIV